MITARYLASVVFLLLSLRICAQDEGSRSIQNFNFWGGFEFNIPLQQKSNWGLLAEGYIKRNDFLAQPMGWFWRLGGTYYLGNGNRLSGGVAYQYNLPYDEAMLPYAWPDWRLWQQYMIHKTAFWNRHHLWTHRLRLEERWLGRKNDSRSAKEGYDYYKFETTFRYMLRSQWYTSVKFGFAVYDELHLRLASSEQGEKLVDQNRVYAGIMYALDKKRAWRIETGYMLQSMWNATDEEPIKIRMNHTWRVTLAADVSL